jgi:hypothetical protein
VRRDSRDKVNKRQHSQGHRGEGQDNRESGREHQAILDWLTPIDYSAQQSDIISRRQEGTGEWLLYSREFTSGSAKAIRRYTVLVFLERERVSRSEAKRAA